MSQTADSNQDKERLKQEIQQQAQEEVVFVHAKRSEVKGAAKRVMLKHRATIKELADR